MKAVLSLLISTMIMASLSQAVVDLSEDTIFSAIQEQPVILVNFYAQWCQYSQKLLPIYDEVALEVNRNDMGLMVARIEYDANKDTFARFNVQNFPNIVLFIEQQPL